MPTRPRQCRAPPRRKQPRRRRAARHTDVEPGAYTERASGNGPQLLARYGQNDRAIAIGRKNWLFAGSDAGGRRAAAMYSLLESAKLNGLNPQLYLADLLARIADHPARHITLLLPWNWQPAVTDRAAA